MACGDVGAHAAAAPAETLIYQTPQVTLGNRYRIRCFIKLPDSQVFTLFFCYTLRFVYIKENRIGV